MDIRQTLQDLATARATEEQLKKQQVAMLLEVQNSDQYTQVDLQRTQAKAEIERLTELVKSKALEEFNGTKNKKPFDGVEIKVFTVVNITDERKAREWCVANFRPALKLDVKVFEKAAKDGHIPDELAKVELEPRAQIAADLSMYLK